MVTPPPVSPGGGEGAGECAGMGPSYPEDTLVQGEGPIPQANQMAKIHEKYFLKKSNVPPIFNAIFLERGP